MKLDPDACRWCERKRQLCACHICADCHKAFWGRLECVKTAPKYVADKKTY